MAEGVPAAPEGIFTIPVTNAENINGNIPIKLDVDENAKLRNIYQIAAVLSNMSSEFLQSLPENYDAFRRDIDTVFNSVPQRVVPNDVYTTDDFLRLLATTVDPGPAAAYDAAGPTLTLPANVITARNSIMNSLKILAAYQLVVHYLGQQNVEQMRRVRELLNIVRGNTFLRRERPAGQGGVPERVDASAVYTLVMAPGSRIAVTIESLSRLISNLITAIQQKCQQDDITCGSGDKLRVRSPNHNEIPEGELKNLPAAILAGLYTQLVTGNDIITNAREDLHTVAAPGPVAEATFTYKSRDTRQMKIPGKGPSEKVCPYQIKIRPSLEKPEYLVLEKIAPGAQGEPGAPAPPAPNAEENKCCIFFQIPFDIIKSIQIVPTDNTQLRINYITQQTNPDTTCDTHEISERLGSRGSRVKRNLGDELKTDHLVLTVASLAARETLMKRLMNVRVLGRRVFPTSSTITALSNALKHGTYIPYQLTPPTEGNKYELPHEGLDDSSEPHQREVHSVAHALQTRTDSSITSNHESVLAGLNRARVAAAYMGGNTADAANAALGINFGVGGAGEDRVAGFVGGGGNGEEGEGRNTTHGYGRPMDVMGCYETLIGARDAFNTGSPDLLNGIKMAIADRTNVVRTAAVVLQKTIAAYLYSNAAGGTGEGEGAAGNNRFATIAALLNSINIKGIDRWQDALIAIPVLQFIAIAVNSPFNAGGGVRNRNMMVGVEEDVNDIGGVQLNHEALNGITTPIEADGRTLITGQPNFAAGDVRRKGLTAYSIHAAVLQKAICTIIVLVANMYQYGEGTTPGWDGTMLNDFIGDAGEPNIIVPVGEGGNQERVRAAYAAALGIISSAVIGENEAEGVNASVPQLYKVVKYALNFAQLIIRRTYPKQKTNEINPDGNLQYTTPGGDVGPYASDNEGTDTGILDGDGRTQYPAGTTWGKIMKVISAKVSDVENPDPTYLDESAQPQLPAAGTDGVARAALLETVLPTEVILMVIPDAEPDAEDAVVAENNTLTPGPINNSATNPVLVGLRGNEGDADAADVIALLHSIPVPLRARAIGQYFIGMLGGAGGGGGEDGGVVNATHPCAAAANAADGGVAVLRGGGSKINTEEPVERNVDVESLEDLYTEMTSGEPQPRPVPTEEPAPVPPQQGGSKEELLALFRNANKMMKVVRTKKDKKKIVSRMKRIVRKSAHKQDSAVKRALTRLRNKLE